MPDGITRPALVVVDVQNGFVNDRSRHAVPAIADLVGKWEALGLPVVFTRYLNEPGSPYVQYFGWSRFMDSPDVDLVPELTEAASRHAVVDKTGYSLFSEDGSRLVEKEGWRDLYFCGIATESCVLKSAIDAFERGYGPWIVTDASASDAGPAVHDAGLVVARRTIGPRQLVTADALLLSVRGGTSA